MAAGKIENKTLKDEEMHYCPGCGHGLINRLVAEAIDQLKLRNNAVGIIGIGCGTFADQYLNIDVVAALHGRAPAVATGIKRALGPESLVFTYQGDGDAISIGLNELIHAASRQELITAVLVNNLVYGMTGGQMSPTSLIGQKTATSIAGRDCSHSGLPLKLSEIIASLDSSAFIARTAVNSPANIRKTRRTIVEAFEYQSAGKGFSMVEILSPCPTGLKMSPVDAAKHLGSVSKTNFPLGIKKQTEIGEDI